MTDPYTDPNYQAPLSGFGSGMLIGPVAQMAATDPRRLLVESLLSQGKVAQQRPMYSKFSALANALTAASGGIGSAVLNKQYQGMQQDYMNQLRDAYAPPAGPAPPVAPAGGSAATEPPAPIQTASLAPLASPSPQQTPPQQIALRQGDDSALPADLIPGAAPSGQGMPQASATSAPQGQSALFSNLEHQYGLPGGTLGRLMQTESSGVPRSGPPLPGGAAQGYFQFTPETAARYGVTPGDLTSEATGAAQYLADLKRQNGGNFSKALVDYGGFQTKDPSRYVGSVTGAPGSQLAQALTPQAQPSAQPSAQPPAGPGGTDPLASQIALAQNMARNPNPLIAYQGIQRLQQLQQIQAQASITRETDFQKQGLTRDASGNIVPLPGYSGARQGITQAEAVGTGTGQNIAKLDPNTGEAAQISARTPAEAAEEAAKAGAQNPALIARAGGIKQAELAPEVLKSILTPQINRVTGGVAIPGTDPATMDKVRSVLGLPPTPGTAPPGGGSPPATAPSPVAPSGPSAPVPYGAKSPAEEVPHVKLPTGEMSLQPGEISPGRDPVAIKAGEDALEQAQHQYAETEEHARGAATMHAQLANMRQQVTSGGVTPSMTGNARYFISSAINAISGPEAAKSITGVDPGAADVLSKEATQLGTQYARQTEGARQAVAGIQIALKANPQLTQSKEGFLKILDILDAGAKHDLVSQEYGNAWFQKNQHYLGFQPWINQNHPPEEFISKVIPLDAPRLQGGPVDESKLQPNVTYQSPKGPAIWTGKGWQLTPQ